MLSFGTRINEKEEQVQNQAVSSAVEELAQANENRLEARMKAYVLKVNESQSKHKTKEWLSKKE